MLQFSYCGVMMFGHLQGEPTTPSPRLLFFTLSWPFLALHFATFPFEVTLDLQASCEGSRENSCVPFARSPAQLRLTFGSFRGIRELLCD